MRSVLTATLLLSANAALAPTSSWARDCWSLHPCTQAERVVSRRPHLQASRHARRRHQDHERDEARSDAATPHCWPALSVVGDASLTHDGAQAQAEQSWIREVRWRYGAVYLDLRNARDIRWRCGQSSVRRIGDAPLQQTCEIVARPCRAPLENEDPQ